MAGPGFFKDISGCTVNATSVEAVQSIEVAINPVKLRTKNNNVYDGSVAITTVDRDLIITIRSQDVAMNGLAIDDVPITIVWVGVPITNTIYTSAASKTFTATLMVPLTDNRTHSQKNQGEFVRSYEMLSGGTLTAA